MWRVFCLILMLFGTPAAAFSQAASPDSQLLQALLAEVHALRQDVSTSMARVEKAQILLSRLQIQQANVTRASERLYESRAKLADAQDHQKHVANDINRLVDTLTAEGNLVQQKELRDRINRSKSELEDSTGIVQQRQAAEIDVEQQLRTEQDKLTTLEAQLDELVRNVGYPREQSGHPQR